MIDMDIPSDSSTRAATPEPTILKPSDSEAVDKDKSSTDVSAKKTGLGSLLKTARQDVSVPEFDMNAFF